MIRHLLAAALAISPAARCYHQLQTSLYGDYARGSQNDAYCAGVNPGPACNSGRPVQRAIDNDYERYNNCLDTN